MIFLYQEFMQFFKSKFGTLVLVKKPIKILKKYIRLQIGRTFIETKLVDQDDVKDKITKIQNEEEKNESKNDFFS